MNKIPESFYERIKPPLSRDMIEATLNSFMISEEYDGSPMNFFEYIDDDMKVVKVVYENKSVFLDYISIDEEEDICFGVVYHKLNENEILRIINAKDDNKVSVIKEIIGMG